MLCKRFGFVVYSGCKYIIKWFLDRVKRNGEWKKLVSKIEKDPRTISGNKTEIETLITPEPKLEKLKERNYLIDNLKAIMIWVVVCTHYLHAANGFSTDSLGGATYLTMISCDMIIFIFASGYFSKKIGRASCRERV